MNFIPGKALKNSKLKWQHLKHSRQAFFATKSFHSIVLLGALDLSPW
jgi:hypothetical protein